MLKSEKHFDALISGSIEIGKPVLIQIAGDILKTSNVVNWSSNIFGGMKIETKNTIYRK